MCLYPGHKHMCLYPLIIYQLVTKSWRPKITTITLILSQITFAQATFYIRLLLLFPRCVWNNEYWAKCTPMIKVSDIKFTYFCLVLMKYHTVGSIICSTLPKHILPFLAHLNLGNRFVFFEAPCTNEFLEVSIISRIYWKSLKRESSPI